MGVGRRRRCASDEPKPPPIGPIFAQLGDKPTEYFSISTKPVLSETILLLTMDIVILPEPMYETWLAVVWKLLQVYRR